MGHGTATLGDDGMENPAGMNTLPTAADAVLAVLLVLAAAVWVGGYVAIVVVARVATATLDSADRVSFFRGLGRRYLLVGGPALVVALVTGGVLLVGRPWGGTLTAVAVLTGVLIGVTVVAVLQARRMTRLRKRALTESADEPLKARVRRGAVHAGLLRACIGLLSVALLVLGVVLAV